MSYECQVFPRIDGCTFRHNDPNVRNEHEKRCLVEALVKAASALSDPERVLFLGMLADDFCLRCGRRYAGPCHCENDE